MISGVGIDFSITGGCAGMVVDYQWQDEDWMDFGVSQLGYSGVASRYRWPISENALFVDCSTDVFFISPSEIYSMC